MDQFLLDFSQVHLVLMLAKESDDYVVGSFDEYLQLVLVLDDYSASLSC